MPARPASASSTMKRTALESLRRDELGAGKDLVRRARPDPGDGARAPEWKSQQPFQAVLQNDTDALAAGGVKAALELVMASHAGMTSARGDGPRETASAQAVLAKRRPPSGQESRGGPGTAR